MTRAWSDWTKDEETGRSNSSPEFLRLVAAVERLIRDEAHNLINGSVEGTARLVMAQLAHVHHLSPPQQEEIMTAYLVIRIPLENAEDTALLGAKAQNFLDNAIPRAMKNPMLTSVEEALGEGLVAAGLPLTDDDFKISIDP